YRLIGIIYYGGSHFTSRVITNEGSIWYHDGIETGKSCIHEGNIADIDAKELATAPYGRKYSTAIYS
ncbi:hypothetical protein BC629DRAFT_1261880, partial [Irpex lacteus]